ncbi:MAG: tetratricopeptide repeat protein [Candidatus Omnitrophica bacterium]|nr:tetratricopeptide repeat protein [Candidatus Omnitrophota bacterium]
MTPETLTALLVVLSLLGVIGLGVFAFFNSRRTDGRIDALNSFLDSLDERLIHKFTAMDRKHEEIRTLLVKMEENLAQERTDREGAANDLYRKTDSILESLTTAKTETATALESLRSDLAESGRVMREEVQVSITRLDESLSGLDARETKHAEELADYARQVRGVRLNNLQHLALSQMHEGKFREAFETLQSVLEEEPEDRAVMLLAAKAALQAGDRAKARPVVERGLKAHPNDPDLLAALSRVLRIEGDRSERPGILAEGLVRHPDHPLLRFERSLLNLENRKYEAARDDLEALLAVGMDNAEVRYNLGVVQVALGNIPAAVRELRVSLAHDPTSAESNHAMGLALLQGDRFREAVDFLERARERRPNSAMVRLDLSMAYRLSGAPESALRECGVARHLAPNLPRVGLEEALAYHAQADFSGALACLESTMELHPDYAPARRLKAQILCQTERHEEAVAEWSRMVQDTPSDPELHTLLGETLKKAGHAAAALGCLEIAARMAPDSIPVQLSFAKEALSQQRFELVQEVVDQAYLRATTPRSRLQLLECRLLAILKLERWAQLLSFVEELKAVLEESPEAIPLDKEVELDAAIVGSLEIGPEAARVYTSLLELYEGLVDFADFDEAVTRALRSLLPPVKPTPTDGKGLAVEIGAPEPPMAFETSRFTGPPAPPFEALQELATQDTPEERYPSVEPREVEEVSPEIEPTSAEQKSVSEETPGGDRPIEVSTPSSEVAEAPEGVAAEGQVHEEPEPPETAPVEGKPRGGKRKKKGKHASPGTVREGQ